MPSDSITKSAADLAAQALKQVSTKGLDTPDDEAAASDQLAETLTTLQSVIERNAHEAKRIKDALKEKRESLRSIFENDTQLSEAQAELEKNQQELKARKVQLSTSPETMALQTQLAELKEQLKEVEEALNSHLLNYFQLTNSTSFDTTDGDQWDFVVSARLKSKWIALAELLA